MAKKKISSKYSNSTAYRGNDFEEPQVNIGYQYGPNDYKEKMIGRQGVRDYYRDMYELEQRRDQRAFARVQDMENEFYAGVDPLRRKELAAGGMIREDRNAMANMPRQAIHCEFPHAGFYTSNYIDNAVREDE